ncbi:MAG: hypothetical protein U0521_17840 [Anaerolineae bacterium]
MKHLFITVAALLLAACGSTTGSLSRITPIPPDDLTAAASAVEQQRTSTIQATATLSILPTSTATTTQPATATPLSNDLPAGNAREIAATTDTAMQPEVAHRLSFDQDPVPIKFDEFYDGYNLRTGLLLSDKLLSLDGKTVQIAGYMAPPLKPELDYFVLTRIRLAFCPFCSTGADWPDDIALVYMNEGTTTVTEYPVRITGRMEIGASIDYETGMVSLVRVYADSLDILQ